LKNEAYIDAVCDYYVLSGSVSICEL